MIYQMTIYYGALLNGEIIYSIETTLEDCTKLVDDFNINVFKFPLEQEIINAGFNPDDFEFRYLSKSEYEDRDNIDNENAKSWTIEKDPIAEKTNKKVL